MINKKIFFMELLIAIVAFLLSGCWDSSDIQEKDIHITQLADYKDGNYILYGEVANFAAESQKGGEAESNKNRNFNIIMAMGKTLAQARDEMNRRSSNPIYLGAGKILGFTDRMAETGLEEYLNRSRSQHDARKSLKIITTPEEPNNLLNAVHNNSSSVGLTIDKMMESLVDEGSSFNVNIGKILEALAVKKAGFLIPEVNIKNSEITFTGYAVFDNAKKIGFIPAEDRQGVVYFLHPKASFNYEIWNNSRMFHLKVSLKKKKIETIFVDGKLSFDVNMNFTAELNYSDKAMPLDDEEKAQLEVILSDTVRQDILKALEASQKTYQCDYLQIYRYFRAEHNSEFKAIDWKKAYSEASSEANTKVLIVDSELPLK